MGVGCLDPDDFSFSLGLGSDNVAFISSSLRRGYENMGIYRAYLHIGRLF